MTIYEITGQALELLEMLNDPECEVSEECLHDTFEALEGELADKVDAYCAIIAEYTAQAEILRAEKSRLDEHIKKADANVLKLKTSLTKCLQELNYKRFETPKHTLNRFTDKKLVIYGTVPGEYKKEVIRKENDTAAIKAALDNGEHLGFARYIKSCSIS